MTASSSSRAAAPTSGARPGSKLLPSLGILLVAGGILLLLWFAWVWFNPGPAPYRYQLVEEGSADKFPQLGLGPWPDLSIARYEVFAEDISQPLAVLHAAGVQLAGMTAAGFVGILWPVLLPPLASVLAPWSLSRIRHI